MELQDFHDIAIEDIERDNTALNGQTYSRNELYRQIDRMINCQYENPESLSELSWIKDRKFITTVPRDSSMASVRTFATLLPQISIEPNYSTEADRDRVEKIERALEWHWKLACNRGEQSPHWKIVQSASNYCNVSMETEYLPYSLKGQNAKRKKQVRTKGDFNFVVHHPSNVHARFSTYGLESVVLAYVTTAQEMIDRYGKDNKGVKQLLKKMDDFDSKSSEKVTPRQTSLCFYKITDWDRAVVYCGLGETLDSAEPEFEMDLGIEDRKHGLDFIPWVIVDNKEPFLKGIVDAGLYDIDNIVRTIQFSMHVERAAHPSYYTESLSVEDPVKMDNTQPGNPLQLTPGQKAGVLPPPPIDPGLAMTIQNADSDIYRSAGTSALANIERYAGGNSSFSQMNAIIASTVAQQGLAKMTAEQAEAEGLHQILRWIYHSKIPLVSYRATDKGSQTGDTAKGAQYMLVPGEEIKPDNKNPNKVGFYPDETYLTVSLKANTLVDKQAETTDSINKIDRLGFSLSTIHDEKGSDYDIEQSKRAAEILFDSEIQKKLAMNQLEVKMQELQMSTQIQTQAQLQMQQAQMQMQQQQMQQQQAQAQNPQNATQGARSEGAFAGAQGMDNRGGGQAAQNPTVGREQVTGQTAAGEEIA